MASWPGLPWSMGNSQNSEGNPNSAAESEEDSFIKELSSATGKYTRSYGGLFPLGSLALLGIDQYIAGEYQSPALQAPEGFLQTLVTQIKLSNWWSLRNLANVVFGPTSFALGFMEGVGESLEGDVKSFIGLAKMLVFWYFYRALEHPRISLITDPVTLGLAEALSLNEAIYHEMRSCYERTNELMHDIGTIVKEPGKFFEAVGKNIKQGAKEDWDTAKRWFENPDLHNDFQFGRAVGQVVYQIVMIALLLWGVAENAARLAARFPQLARLIRIMKTGGQLEALEAPERVAGGASQTLKEVEEGMKTAGTAEPPPASRPVVADASETESPVYKGKLRGKVVELKGVETKRIQYTKRSAEDLETLRNQFDRSGRRAFLKKVSTDPKYVEQLRTAGLTDKDLLKMQSGRNPDGWQVHHKLPLDDGGTNDFDNLVLIKNDPYHLAITNAQGDLTDGMAAGQTRTVDFPIPAGESVAYPPIPETPE